MNRKADERLQNHLQQKLLSQGIRPPCRVSVAVRDGVVTLSGTVQHDYQKRSAIHACRAMSGVKRVVDNLHTPGFHNVWVARKEWEPVRPAAPQKQEAGQEDAGEQPATENQPAATNE